MLHRASLFSAVLAGCLTLTATAQINTMPSSLRNHAKSTISGAVRSNDDRPIPDARVEVRMLGTEVTSASGYTDPSGSFQFNDLAPGTYEVTAEVGLESVTDRVTIQGDMAMVTLHVRADKGGTQNAGTKSTVSVASMKVPEKAREECRKAQEALRKKDTDGAWKRVSKSLELAPQFAEALTVRALLELDKNNTDAAIADLEKAVDTDRGYGLSFLVLGSVYNGLSRFDDALRVLDHGVALMPNSWQAYFEMAKSNLGKNNLKGAQAQLERCSTMAPADYAPLHLVRANLYLALKNYAEAMGELEAYLQRDPSSPQSDAARKTLDKVKAFVAQK